MSDAVHLRLREAGSMSVAVEGLTADRLAALSESAIAALPAWHGRRRSRIGDFFDVRGGYAPRVRVEGQLEQIDGVGEGMTGGELTIDGNAGARVGLAMTGGRIEVRGNVGADAGAAMAGGRLHIRGAAGDRLGAMLPGASRGMTGGEILVEGPAGTDAGARMRRGLLVIGEDAGRAAARNMIAGSVIVFGRTAEGAAIGNKRGTLVAIGGIAIPGSYSYACTFRPPHLAVTMRYLAREFGVRLADAVRDGVYRRYCGDAGAPGKGEILEWVRP